MPFMPYYYGIDWTYLVLVLPFVIISLIASAKVNSTFKKYSKQLSSRRITGAQAAQRVLLSNGVTNVRIERIAGNLTDHFDPKTNVIRLSDSVYGSTSTAAIGVACHEAGHAVQHATAYAPIKIRSAFVPVANIGSALAIPLIILGLLFASFGEYSQMIVNIGIFCFSFSFLFQVITLPVEFNASRRALNAIADGDILTNTELKGARRTLTAAAMTYMAAAAASLAQLLRLIILFGGRDRD